MTTSRRIGSLTVSAAVPEMPRGVISAVSKEVPVFAPPFQALHPIEVAENQKIYSSSVWQA